MRKFLVISLISVLSAALLFACQREGAVQAGTQQGADASQPGTAPTADASVDGTKPQEIRGELIRVDEPRRIFSVRIENGMEQSFQFDDRTMVIGLETTQVGATAGTSMSSRVRDLAGKEGSEVTIQWKDKGSDSPKMATQVVVTEQVTTKKKRKRQ